MKSYDVNEFNSDPNSVDDSIPKADTEVDNSTLKKLVTIKWDSEEEKAEQSDESKQSEVKRKTRKAALMEATNVYLETPRSPLE